MPPPVSDELAGWVEATRKGDAAAARRLLEAVAPAVHSVVRRALGPAHADIDDLVQDSLVGFVKALDTYRGECSVLHYARRIALWRVLEERKRARAAKRGAGTGSDQDPSELGIEANSHSKVVDAQRRTLLRELLHTLRPEQAEALAMRHVLDYSVEEIAEATGVPGNTVRSRLRLAKQALRVHIDRHGLLASLDLGEP